MRSTRLTFGESTAHKVKGLQTISVRHLTKFELMLYVEVETPIGFTIPPLCSPAPTR
jgi:hypothetical protein